MDSPTDRGPRKSPSVQPKRKRTLGFLHRTGCLHGALLERWPSPTSRVGFFLASFLVMLQLQKRRTALTHLDHVAVLDYSPQQFPVFCLILLLFQVGSMLFMEKEDWSQRGNNGQYLSTAMQNHLHQFKQEPQK